MDSSAPPAKTRAVEGAPSDLAPVLAPLLEKIEALQAELASLRLGPGSALPTYPSQVSKTALDTMASDPRLPDPLRATIALLTRNLTLMDDRTAELTQDAYAALAPWIQQLPLPTPANANPANPPQRVRDKSPHGERFQLVAGEPYYRSAQGKLWDTTQAPPYPCRRCHCLHWNWTPCPQIPNQTPNPTPYYPQPYPTALHYGPPQYYAAPPQYPLPIYPPANPPVSSSTPAPSPQTPKGAPGPLPEPSDSRSRLPTLPQNNPGPTSPSTRKWRSFPPPLISAPFPCLQSTAHAGSPHPPPHPPLIAVRLPLNPSHIHPCAGPLSVMGAGYHPSRHQPPRTRGSHQQLPTHLVKPTSTLLMPHFFLAAVFPACVRVRQALRLHTSLSFHPPSFAREQRTASVSGMCASGWAVWNGSEWWCHWAPCGFYVRERENEKALSRTQPRWYRLRTFSNKAGSLSTSGRAPARWHAQERIAQAHCVLLYNYVVLQRAFRLLDWLLSLAPIIGFGSVALRMRANNHHSIRMRAAIQLCCSTVPYFRACFPAPNFCGPGRAGRAGPGRAGRAERRLKTGVGVICRFCSRALKRANKPFTKPPT